MPWPSSSARRSLRGGDGAREEAGSCDEGREGADEGHEGYEGDEGQQDRTWKDAQSFGLPWFQGEDLGRPDQGLLDEELAGQGREQGRLRAGQEGDVGGLQEVLRAGGAGTQGAWHHWLLRSERQDGAGEGAVRQGQVSARQVRGASARRVLRLPDARGFASWGVGQVERK